MSLDVPGYHLHPQGLITKNCIQFNFGTYNGDGTLNRIFETNLVVDFGIIIDSTGLRAYYFWRVAGSLEMKCIRQGVNAVAGTSSNVIICQADPSYVGTATSVRFIGNSVLNTNASVYYYWVFGTNLENQTKIMPAGHKHVKGFESSNQTQGQLVSWTGDGGARQTISLTEKQMNQFMIVFGYTNTRVGYYFNNGLLETTHDHNHNTAIEFNNDLVRSGSENEEILADNDFNLNAEETYGLLFNII